MKRDWLSLLICLILTATLNSIINGQGTTAPLSGVVTDPTGATLPGAKVIIKNNATGAEYNVISGSNGNYTVPALSSGLYTATFEAAGFKKIIVENIKLDVGVPATVNAVLEVGGTSESVVVQGGAEVLQTQSAQISTTITGRQITETPFTSRDALDLVLLLPGTNTPGRPRTSTINGLPKGAINITMDGINVQDNMGKSSDGFFTFIRPRIDAIEEVTVSTNNPGADSAGEGAIQIKFVTKGGTNEYHGSLYEYHRNPALNANYYFNNLAGQPRSRVLLNQFGFKVGGPFQLPKVYNGKDKAFFFVNYEEFRLPEQTLRTRTILNESARSGLYTYQYQKANVDGSKTTITNSVNLLALTGNKGSTSNSADPMISKVLAGIRQSTTTTGSIVDNDLNTQRFSFINSANSKRYFPTLRLDYNLTNKHHLENIYNYQSFSSSVDFLNSVDPAFPGSPVFGNQASNRFSNSTALRSTLTSSLVNEFRIGIMGGTSVFRSNMNANMFANTSGYALNINSALNIQNYYSTRTASRRNTPVLQFNDTVSWTKGSHNMTFGGSYSRISSWSSVPNDGVVQQVSFGLASGDPNEDLFIAANFPGASNSQLNQARSLYSVLTGRITAITGTVVLDENTGKYQYAGNLVRRAQMKEFGTFAQDSWRFRPNLTLSYGLRWEVQMPFTALNSNFSYTSPESVYGISGPGNLFNPGATAGSVPQYTQFKKGDKAYNTDWNALAPSFGFSWSPNFGGKSFKYLFGEGGQTVFRGGYSIAYNREGITNMISILGSNPGGVSAANYGTTASAFKRLTPGTLLRNGIPGKPDGLPESAQFPLLANSTNSLNAFANDLQTPYVQSWSFGIQREIDKSTAIEVRYVGNRGIKLWRQYNVNELNITNNGFLNEFKIAQANLAANGGKSFAYNPSVAGTSPLPNITKFFYTKADGSLDPKLFENSTFIGYLNSINPNPYGFAYNLYSNYMPVAAGLKNSPLPANYFVVNPTVGIRGSFLLDNGGRSSYDSLQIELRRRLSRGLLVQGSYVFAKSLTNEYASQGDSFSQYISLRDPGLNKSLSPFNITHGFKANWIYELPFGKGKPFGGNVGRLANLAIGGWEFHGAARLQSGAPNSLFFGYGSVPGGSQGTIGLGNVSLVGMTADELRSMIKIRKEKNNKVYWLPQSVIDNTLRAFGNGDGKAPEGKYIAPINYNNPAVVGSTGFSNLIVYGPRMVRFDLTAMKRFRITEKTNFELRAEFLNAFNNTNFLLGSAGNNVNTISVSSQTFGQTTNAYQDLSTTNDPGGRLIQIVARFNF